MTDHSTSPLLGPALDENEPEPLPKTSQRSIRSSHSTESTPLLAREHDQRQDGQSSVAPSLAASSLKSIQEGPSRKGRRGRRWPVVLALSLLSVTVMVIMAAVFFAPAVAREYAMQALVVEPTNLSIDSFTSKGVRARVQATIRLDASRVQNGAVRTLGRAGTWIVKAVECDESQLEVYAPEYGNVLLGVATIPQTVINIRDGVQNQLDLLSDVEPGHVDGFRTIANDWLEGRLGQLRVQGKAIVALKSGMFSLGTQRISESFAFEGHDLPAIPEHNITRLSLHEAPSRNGGMGVALNASVAVSNPFPVQFTLPPLTFDALISNCLPDDPLLMLASATSEAVRMHPRTAFEVQINGLVRELPDMLIRDCPDSELSPLDVFVGSYIHGKDTKVYVRGSTSQPADTPDWITRLISSITVPVPVSGRTFDNLMKNFTLANVHLVLPDPMADPDTPAAQPRLSAVAKASIKLPTEMNFPVNVSRVRVDADVLYRKKKLGRLDLRKWQAANSSRVENDDDDEALLLVESIIEDAPLRITDTEVFSEVVQALMFGEESVKLGIKADVDVDMSTALGQFVLKDIPAQGNVAIKPIKGGIASSNVKVGSVKIIDTSDKTLSIQATVNFTNPTDYTAHVPYMDIKFLNNGTVLGHGTIRNVTIVPGQNDDVVADSLWAPWSEDGEEGAKVGRELLSQYISGFNVTLTVKMHEGSIPSQPALGKALSAFEIKIPVPKLATPHLPGDGDDGDDDTGDSPSFIDHATMHLFTSTATFTLVSPFDETTMYITHMDATAFYNHTHLVGTILYDLPFAIPPGIAETPRLPVDWSLDSIGYDAVRSALGGRLKLDTNATVGVRIGQYTDTMWFIGRGIGARVRF